MSVPVAIQPEDLPSHPEGECVCSVDQCDIEAIRACHRYYRLVWSVERSLNDGDVDGMELLYVIRLPDGSLCMEDQMAPRHVRGAEISQFHDVWEDALFPYEDGPTLLRMWADAEERRIREDRSQRFSLLDGSNRDPDDSRGPAGS